MASKEFKGVNWDDDEQAQKDKDEQAAKDLDEAEAEGKTPTDITIRESNYSPDEVPVVFAQEYPKRKKKGAKSNLLDEAKDEAKTDAGFKQVANDDWLTEMMKSSASYNRPHGRGINPKHLRIMRKRALR